MNLNKNNNKRNKFAYDGNKIILKGTRELYPFVYKRIWDLTQYDTSVLERYGLSKAMYVYIGSSKKYNVKDRCSQFKNDVINNKSFVAKKIREFIRGLKLFYQLETNYMDKEIDYLLYYNANVIGRCGSRANATKLEEHFTSKYHYLDFYGEILEQHTILLSKKDSRLKDIEQGAVKALCAR